MVIHHNKEKKERKKGKHFPALVFFPSSRALQICRISGKSGSEVVFELKELGTQAPWETQETPNYSVKTLRWGQPTLGQTALALFFFFFEK